MGTLIYSHHYYVQYIHNYLQYTHSKGETATDPHIQNKYNNIKQVERGEYTHKEKKKAWHFEFSHIIIILNTIQSNERES